MWRKADGTRHNRRRRVDGQPTPPLQELDSLGTYRGVADRSSQYREDTPTKALSVAGSFGEKTALLVGRPASPTGNDEARCGTRQLYQPANVRLGWVALSAGPDVRDDERER